MSELEEKGFVQVYRGGFGKGDRNRYILIDDYLSWEPTVENQKPQSDIGTDNQEQTNLINIEDLKRDSKSVPIKERV